MDSFIDMDVGDAVELKAQPEGTYHLTCNDAEVREGNNGPYILLRLEIPDQLDSKGITHVMMLPQNSDEPKQQNRRKLSVKKCCEAFGVDYQGGFDVKDFVNQEAEAYLRVEESEEYGRQNRVSYWITGAEEEDENRSDELALG